jgi:hypothetical protein
MKKSIFTFLFLTCLSFSYGQETIFLETCGTTDISSPKKVDTYTGWDNSAPVTFTRTTTLDGYADVRITSSMTNHVWFPYDKNSDLIISNIPAENYHNLKLSFDIAAYKLADANVNKLTVLCNDSALTIPSEVFTSSKFITVSDIELNNSETITLKFQYSAENNINGYRLDNFKITGDKVTSDVYNPSVTNFNPFISGNELIISNITYGTPVEVYNLLGSLIQTSVLNGRSIELNRNITKGLYIIRAGKQTAKVTL